jgi:hypothetical protein
MKSGQKWRWSETGEAATLESYHDGSAQVGFHRMDGGKPEQASDESERPTSGTGMPDITDLAPSMSDKLVAPVE